MIRVTRSEAETILEPHCDIIQSCIVSGWNDFKKKQRGDEHKYETRTKAGIIRDYIVDNARMRFANTSGVNCLDSDKDRLFLLDIEGLFLIRFKKLGMNLKASNFLTNQAISYSAQQFTPGDKPVQMDLPFPDQLPGENDLDYFEQPICLNAGYVPDEHWEELNGTYIVCPDNNKIAWFFDLEDKQTISLPEQLPVTQSTEQNKRRVWLRDDSHKKSTVIKEQKDGTAS